MPKKILVIDDSALMRRVISDIINESDEYEVAAIARDGLEGFDLIVSNPDMYSAVILDINMPKMNGLELLQKLQQNHIDQTVIVVSTVAKQGAKETIQALEYGAFDFVTKPENYFDTKSENFKQRIHEMLNIATNTKASMERSARMSGLVKAKPKPSLQSSSSADVEPPKRRDRTAGYDALEELRRRNREAKERMQAAKVEGRKFTGVKTGKNKIIALACSTGGPKSLQQVIPMLPPNIDAGIVLVQHMPVGFTASLATRLDEMSEVHVKEAADNDIIKKGWVYIAPGGKHLLVEKSRSEYVIRLSDAPPVDGLKPCANLMYNSLRNVDYDEITCVVLTGMGADGTSGIKGLSDSQKNIYVIAQDEDTCVVYGMPKAIAQTGLVNEVVPLNQIAEAITKNVGVS